MDSELVGERDVRQLDRLKQVFSRFSEKSNQEKGYEVLKNCLRGLDSEEARDDLNKLLFHLCYNELRVVPGEKRVLVTESVLIEERAREAMARLLFEQHCFTAVMFVPQEFLALVASGRDTGLVVNMGDTYTSIVPIWKFNLLRHCTTILPFGGRDVTEALKLLLEKRHGLKIYKRFTDLAIVEDIKAKHGYVAKNYELELLKKPAKHVTYELPDCQTLDLGQELFQSPELLFSPELVGIKNSPGLIDGIVGVIGALDPEIRNDILDEGAGILLSGSSSMFQGLVPRIEEELAQALPSCPTVIAPPERKSLSWIGGSIWTTLSFTKNDWTTLEEFKKFGPGVVHGRCM